MTVTTDLPPVRAATAPLRTKPSNYPEPFFSRMARREKRPLGDLFGLKKFGVNLTTLLPGGESALLHRQPGCEASVEDTEAGVSTKSVPISGTETSVR